MANHKKTGDAIEEMADLLYVRRTKPFRSDILDLLNDAIDQFKEMRLRRDEAVEAYQQLESTTRARDNKRSEEQQVRDDFEDVATPRMARRNRKIKVRVEVHSFTLEGD